MDSYYGLSTQSKIVNNLDKVPTHQSSRQYCDSVKVW